MLLIIDVETGARDNNDDDDEEDNNDAYSHIRYYKYQRTLFFSGIKDKMMTNFINAGVATGKTRNAFATSFARFFETIEKSIILLSFAKILDHMIAFRSN